MGRISQSGQSLVQKPVRAILTAVRASIDAVKFSEKNCFPISWEKGPYTEKFVPLFRPMDAA